MPGLTSRPPVWLKHGDRFLVRAREHRASFEANGRDFHLERATANFHRASWAYLEGVLRDEATPPPPLSGAPQKDAAAAVAAIKGPYRSHAAAALHAAETAVINPDSRDAPLRFARTLAEQLRAGFPSPPADAGGGRGAVEHDRTSTLERSR